MEENTVYYGSVEYKYKPGSSGYGKYNGGFVYIFVNARDVLDCIPKIEKEFKELNIEILGIEFLSKYDEIPWETEEEQIRYDSLAKEAHETGDFITDSFYAYEDE